jgi:hypothetical protein
MAGPLPRGLRWQLAGMRVVYAVCALMFFGFLCLGIYY